MSDYLPIFVFFSSESLSYKTDVKSYRTDYSEQNLTKFRTSLSQMDWTSVVMGQDPNKSFDSFSTEYNKHFEDNKLDRAKGDLKETWRLINEVINTESKQSSLPSSFKSNGIVITDPFEIAMDFVDILLTLAIDISYTIDGASHTVGRRKLN